MCGICAHTRDHDGSAVRRMNARMVHRGPDDEGVHVDAEVGVALGARRLSIIDVAGGHQPVSNEDGSVWAALNGEIYNHPELQQRLLARGHRLRSRTDTEVLVHLYEDVGDDLVHALEGMFAFAIWDAKRHRLLAARDRFGEKPLFYSATDGAPGSGLRAHGAASGARGRSRARPGVRRRLLRLRLRPGPAAIARDVRQLPPGHLMHWDQDRPAARARSATGGRRRSARTPSTTWT